MGGGNGVGWRRALGSGLRRTRFPQNPRRGLPDVFVLARALEIAPTASTKNKLGNGRAAPVYQDDGGGEEEPCMDDLSEESTA